MCVQVLYRRELQLHLAGYPDTRELVDFIRFHLAQWLK
jgi:hypothetical protein